MISWDVLSFKEWIDSIEGYTYGQRNSMTDNTHYPPINIDHTLQAESNIVIGRVVLYLHMRTQLWHIKVGQAMRWMNMLIYLTEPCDDTGKKTLNED